MEYEFELPPVYVVAPSFSEGSMIECYIDRKRNKYECPTYVEKLHSRKFVKKRFRRTK